MKKSISILTRAAYKYLHLTSNVRVFGYTNSYIFKEGLKTRIHLNNFLTTLFPELYYSIDIVIELYSANGKFITKKKYELPYMGSKVVELEKIFGTPPPQLGMVIVYAELSKKLMRELVQKNINQVNTYFFVSWETPEGNFSCSHAIEAHKSKYYQIPWFIAPLIKPIQSISSNSWKSSKTIQTDGLENIKIAISNPGSIKKEFFINLSQKNISLYDKKICLNPRATELIELDCSNLTFSKDSVPLEIFLSQLIGNAKPYIFLKYKSQGYFAHHL